MNKLAVLKNNDIFTDSLVIADGTDNEHNSITRLIRNFEDDFKDFGEILFLDLKSKNKTETRGRKQKIYLLNEQQATLLMTYLKNTKNVRAFKKELVRQFYHTRQLLLEKQTKFRQDTREESKTNRLAETAGIKEFVEYAKSQGSKNAEKYYITLSKLANKAAGLESGQRDTAVSKQLNNLILIENIIENVIRGGIKKSVSYKDIYQDCKDRIENFVSIAYLKTA